jgi:hypothetical protein
MTLTEFADVQTQEVLWQADVSVDGYGKSTYATSRTLRCRVAKKVRMVRNAAGEETVSSTQVWLDDVYGVEVDDKLTLPDGTAPTILFVETFETLLPHEKVYLQ